MPDMKALSDRIREISYDIHVYHGHGHLEKVYENAPAHRLRSIRNSIRSLCSLR